MDEGIRRNKHCHLKVTHSRNHYTDGGGTHYVSNFGTDIDFVGQGYGKALLEEVAAEADRAGVTLWLVVVPTEPCDELRLTSFYRRHGFEGGDWGGVMHRYPKRVDTQPELINTHQAQTS